MSSLYASRIDKSVRRAHHGAMPNDTKPDNATYDSVTNAELIVRVHAFLCALLTFLGFNVLQQSETISSALDTLEAWLDDAKKIRRDPQGATARIWWEAFKFAWVDDESETAGKRADLAVAEFGKRFLPVAEEEDRDTLNTADFDAMRAELDQADRYRSEIGNAIDGIEGDRAFTQSRWIDELRAERDALLKANAHHANEIELLRNDLHGSNASVILARSDCDALKAQLAGAIVPLPKPNMIVAGQRWHRLHVVDVNEDGDVFTNRVVDPYTARELAMLHNETAWIYLGTDKV